MPGRQMDEDGVVEEEKEEEAVEEEAVEKTRKRREDPRKECVGPMWGRDDDILS